MGLSLSKDRDCQGFGPKRSGEYQKRIPKMSILCQDGVSKISGGCQEELSKTTSGCQEEAPKKELVEEKLCYDPHCPYNNQARFPPNLNKLETNIV